VIRHTGEERPGAVGAPQLRGQRLWLQDASAGSFGFMIKA
jgi:hypothetical protein